MYNVQATVTSFPYTLSLWSETDKRFGAHFYNCNLKLLENFLYFFISLSLTCSCETHCHL